MPSIFFLLGTAFAQDRKLIEAAQKDGGKVVVYGSLDSDTGDAIGNAFFKKTGVKMDYWRASSTKVMDRASTEYRAGRPLFDVLINNASPIQILLKDGMLTKYISPSAKGFSKDVIDPNLGPRYRNVVFDSFSNRPFEQLHLLIDTRHRRRNTKPRSEKGLTARP